MHDKPYIKCESIAISRHKQCRNVAINRSLSNGKRKINARYNSIIVDKEGNEFPYILSKYVRNEEKLLNFDYIYTIYYKTLDQILKEIPITLKTESCKICEGGGWYSTGTRYFYKDIYCEI